MFGGRAADPLGTVKDEAAFDEGDVLLAILFFRKATLRRVHEEREEREIARVVRVAIGINDGAVRNTGRR